MFCVSGKRNGKQQNIQNICKYKEELKGWGQVSNNLH
jgi:hypothetical protein